MRSRSEFARAIDELGPMKGPELVLDQASALHQRLLEEVGFSQNTLRTWDHWMDNVMPAQIMAQTITTASSTIVLQNIRVLKPMGTFRGVEGKLYPMMARNRKLTYRGMVLYDAHHYYATPGQPPLIERDLRLGQVPIMLGSKYCHLHGLSAAEKIALGEDPNDPLGYFIIKGGEKTINNQEKLRESIPTCIFADSKGKIEGRETIPTITGSLVILIHIGKKWQTLKVALSHTGKSSHIPLFILYRLIGYEPDAARRWILDAVRPEWQRAVNFALEPSLAKYNSISDPIAYLRNKRRISEKEARERILGDIERDLYPNLNSEKDPAAQKARHLGILAARTLEVLLGLRKPDDRDQWSLKRIELPGRSMSILFNLCFSRLAQQVRDTFGTSRTGAGDPRIAHSLFSRATLADNLESAFAPNSWGAKCGSHKENITDSLKRETPLAIFSQIGRINTPTNRRAGQISIRSVQLDQVGYVCFETPEGEGIGLVKNIASTTHCSLERGTDELKAVLDQYPSLVGGNRDTTYPHFLSANGIVWGYCDGPALAKWLVTLRRHGYLPFDCCINFNRVDLVLEYYTTGARPCRPLLLVDDDGKLVIDEKKMWNLTDPETGEKLSIMDLVSRGVIEYVDSREQEWIMLAKNVVEARQRREQRQTLLTRYQAITERLAAISSRNQEVVGKIGELVIDPVKYGTLNAAGLPEVELKRQLTSVLRDADRFWGLVAESQGLTREQQELLKEGTGIQQSLQNLPSFTHCEVHPSAMFGVAAAMIPRAQDIQGPRVNYQANMGKQALGLFHWCHHLRFDTSFKVLLGPQRTFFEPLISQPAGLNTAPNGTNVVIAFLARKDNHEDGLIICKEFLDENFMLMKFTTHTLTERRMGDLEEIFRRPQLERQDTEGIYDAIEPDGMPRIGAYVRQGQAIIGRERVKVTREGHTIRRSKPVNASHFAGVGEEGIIDRVLITFNPEGSRIVKVKIRQTRIQIPGDKFAARCAQKGTICRVVPASEMPRIIGGPNDGTRLDVIINPHAIPSRMTMSMLKEILTYKHAAYFGERVDATTFNELDLARYQRELATLGLDPHGEEQLVHPDGTPFKKKVMVGMCSYQSLRYHVLDKIQARAQGAIKPINHQPVSGRSREGGLRLGEMERDAIIAHGATQLLLERLMKVSDQYKTLLCNRCGYIAISKVRAPQRNECRICGADAQFGTIIIPYVFKLIIQTLAGMGITVILKARTKVRPGALREEYFLE